MCRCILHITVLYTKDLLSLVHEIKLDRLNIILSKSIFLPWDVDFFLLYSVRSLDVCSVSEYEQKWWALLVLWVFSPSLLLSPAVPRLTICSTRWFEAGVYSNSRQAEPRHTAERHGNVLYALNGQDDRDKIVREVHGACPVSVKTRYGYSPVWGTFKLNIVSQFVWIAIRSGWKVLPLWGCETTHTRKARKDCKSWCWVLRCWNAHTVNWGPGCAENPDWSLVSIWGIKHILK